MYDFNLCNNMLFCFGSSIDVCSMQSYVWYHYDIGTSIYYLYIIRIKCNCLTQKDRKHYNFNLQNIYLYPVKIVINLCRIRSVH